MSHKQDTNIKQQQGGSGSDWVNSFYAYTSSPAELSTYTLKYIDQAPMFNPLYFGKVFPTGTSGIIPTGLYLATSPTEQNVGYDTAQEPVQVVDKLPERLPVYYSPISSQEVKCAQKRDKYMASMADSNIQLNKIYHQLMNSSAVDLYQLCSQFNVPSYDQRNKCPKEKSKLCRRLARRLAKNANKL
jgi:hypothetical protein